MNKYLGKILVFFEALAMVGQSVNDDDVVLITLKDLGPACEHFITTIVIEANQSSKPITFVESDC